MTDSLVFSATLTYLERKRYGVDPNWRDFVRERWYHDCCKAVKPASWCAHLCTAKHVAAVFGVSRLELLRTARRLAAVIALEEL